MASENDQALLQENIEEYVNDDNKIVTCKWLSLTHNININAAKRALHIFVDYQRNKGGNEDINVTYFVAGLGKSKDGDLMHKCAVVPETELNVVKKSLSTITSCHIFSVQKAKLKDYTPLYMTDYEVIRNNIEKCNSLSSIKCPWVSLRSAAPASKAPQQNVPSKPENKENTSASKKTGSCNESTSSVPKASGKRAEPKGSIATMFAVAGKKDGGGDQSSKAAQRADTETKSKAADKKGGVMAFFNKKEVSPKEKDCSPTPAESSKKDVASSKKPESKVSLKEKQEPKRKKKQVESDEKEPDQKKRRRIRTDLFDSSDDENDEEAEENAVEEEEQEEESPITISPEQDDDLSHQNKERSKTTTEAEEAKESKSEEVSPTSNAASTGKKRKRAKKVVTKHYQDEEGFMVTKKETVWESETDDEEEEPAVKKEPTPSKPAVKPANKNVPAKAEPKGKTTSKKNTSPQKHKQTSMMSFFKKK
ncbi:DNA polymerase delta subunit 3-like [Plakobranchus ocellatus]|uniref:DNA polymerase delta subunit 3 n=1 Tax=Plakobranchus ocellatus TaxID=259542 RepID=A0AAV4D2F4_9GAST|nr:DNA polymerase delta subunit 3-like [Plakobranchus ocellatus]